MATGSDTSNGLLAAGVILGILASMSGTAGKQCMRFSELQRRKGTVASLFMAKGFMALGLSLNVLVGPLIDMASYAFAPQSVIAPLGGLDVVWNTLTAPFTLGETLTPRLFCGCVTICGGAIMTSLTGSHDSGSFTPETVEAILIRPTVLFYMIALAAWLLFNILVLMPRSAAPVGEPWQSGDRLRGLSLGMTAGSIAGNMFCVKAFVEIVQDSIERQSGEAWTGWLPYGLLAGAVFFAVSNLLFLTKAMREYEALFMGAVFEGSLIISACISGVVVFSELESLQTWQVALYWVAIVLITGGIYVVSTGSEPVKEEKDKPEVSDEVVEPEASKWRRECGLAPLVQDGGGVKAATIPDLASTLKLVAAVGVDEDSSSPVQGKLVEEPVIDPEQGSHLRFFSRSDEREVEDGNVYSSQGGGCVPASTVPADMQATPIVGSCLCADGISCFCGMHVLRSKYPGPICNSPCKPVLSHAALESACCPPLAAQALGAGQHLISRL